MIVTGMFVLLASFFSNSTIAALIGLGLTFWGSVLIYVQPKKSAGRNLIETAMSPSLMTLNQTIQELGYKGDVTYLPPKYFTNPLSVKVCVTKDKSSSLPTPGQIRSLENQPLDRTSQTMVLDPPGIQLSRILERAFGENFVKTDLETLQLKLPKISIEDLEIAENLEILSQNDITIVARITKPAGGLAFKKDVASSVDWPIFSAIAIALTKVTNKPVRIIDSSSSGDGDIMEASYLFIEV